MQRSLFVSLGTACAGVKQLQLRSTCFRMWWYITSAPSATDCILLTAALLLALYIWGTKSYAYFQNRPIHYLRPKLPLLGNMTSVLFGVTSFPEMIKQLYDEGKGHGLLGLFEFKQPVIMVRDPDLLKVLVVKDFDSFVNRRTISIDEVEPLFAKNLSNLKDQRWRDVRATLSPAFTTSKIKGMFPFISQAAQQMADHLVILYSESAEGKKNTPMEVDMKDVFSRLANDVIATSAFGVTCDSLKERENEFYKMGKALTSFSLKQTLVFVGYMMAPKLMQKLRIKILNPKSVGFFDRLVHETVSERERRNIWRSDMIQLLMQARKGELKDDAGEEERTGARRYKFDDDDMSAQAIIFFFAGFETVSVTLCMISYALSFNPEVQKRLQKEVDEMMLATDGKPTYEAVQGMKYLDAVINETLRLLPTAPATDRQCSQDTLLPASTTTIPVKIPKNSVISIPIIGLHHDPQYWKDPMTFDPERFSDLNKHSIKPFTYLPFGAGPRLCIGQRFALIELKLTLVHLLAKFDLHPSSKLKYPIEYQRGFNLAPKGGFLCDLKPR